MTIRPTRCGGAGAVRARLAAALAILLIPGAAPAFAQGAGAPPPPKVSVAKPIVKEVVERDEFIGRFEAVDVVEVRARVGGYLEKVHFTDGAIVKAGDLLVTIDRRPYQAALERAQATVASVQSRVEFSQGDLERAESLQRTGNVAGQVLDQRRQTFQGAQADLAGNKAAVETARLDLEFTEVRAPIGGRIGRKLVSEGNLVSANTTLLTTIVSIDPMQFYFDVDERTYLAYDRVARKEGGAKAIQVEVAVAGDAEASRPGRIDFIDNRLDPQSGTMRVRAVFPNKDGGLTPGVFGRVTVPGSVPYRGVLVPDEAIGSDQDRRVVFVVAEDNSVSMRPVRPGPRLDGYRVIREGLKGDETIVVNGLARVRPGVKVDPQPVTLPPTKVAQGG